MNIDVATSGRGRDINTESEAVATSACKEIKVATSFSGRDISCQERRSRHHSAVATLSAKERRLRHHLAVATSVALKGGRDITQ